MAIGFDASQGAVYARSFHALPAIAFGSHPNDGVPKVLPCWSFGYPYETIAMPVQRGVGDAVKQFPLPDKSGS